MNGSDSVDKTYPMVGTNALKYGFGALMSNRKYNTMAYVAAAMMALLVLLVSHALSPSTRWFRSRMD